MTDETKTRAEADVADYFAALRRMTEGRWRTIVPPRFADARIADLDPEWLRPLVEEWVPDASKSLLLYGPAGTGKTFAACAAARGRWDDGCEVAFRSTSSLMERLRPDGPDTIDALASVPLLVLDDLGAEKPTDWTRERLDLLIDARWSAMLPAIYTSNLDPAALAAYLGDRCWSRISDGATKAAKLSGADRRKQR